MAIWNSPLLVALTRLRGRERVNGRRIGKPSTGSGGGDALLQRGAHPARSGQGEGQLLARFLAVTSRESYFRQDQVGAAMPHLDGVAGSQLAGGERQHLRFIGSTAASRSSAAMSRMGTSRQRAS